MSTVLTCQRCGGDMPPLPDDLAAVLRSGASVQVVHDQCPGDPEPAADELRYFEVRTQIVEVRQTEVRDGGELRPDVVELIDFRHGVRAPDLAAAMRPLADGLGEKWQRAEEHAAIADSDPDPQP